MREAILTRLDLKIELARQRAEAEKKVPKPASAIECFMFERQDHSGDIPVNWWLDEYLKKDTQDEFQTPQQNCAMVLTGGGWHLVYF